MALSIAERGRLKSQMWAGNPLDRRATEQVQATIDRRYAELESSMMHENRSYTAASPIMKTKHDTVKNSISNVR